MTSDDEGRTDLLLTLEAIECNLRRRGSSNPAENALIHSALQDWQRDVIRQLAEMDAREGVPA